MIAGYWLLVIANAVAVATLVAGWVAVPLVCLLGAIAAPRRAAPLISVPLGAMVGWGVLLVRSSRAEAFDRLSTLIAALAPVSVPAMIAVTLAFSLVLSLGAALIGGGLRPTSPKKREVAS